MKLVMVKLTKRFDRNMPGETAGFSPDTAAHILKHDGGESICEFDDATHRFDPSTRKAVALGKGKDEK